MFPLQHRHCRSSNCQQSRPASCRPQAASSSAATASGTNRPRRPRQSTGADTNRPQADSSKPDVAVQPIIQGHHESRKNPELYALTAESPITPHQQLDVDLQLQQQQQLFDPAGISWLNTQLHGTVGSTGSFSSSKTSVATTSPPSSSSRSSSSSSDTLAHQLGSSSSRASKSHQQQQQQLLLLQRKPEVLAPAGGWPQLRAAVENGADAVYFGVTGFNARARAANFEVHELSEVMSYLRERGVKGYVALNVLVFDEELHRLEEVIRQLAAAGVDALIVQDVGAVALARRVAPNLPIHGSTQMSITSAEGAEFAARLGVSRVVVGRELSVSDIAKVAADSSTEVEAFCHGALCVSYSGQCFSSEAWGGRSANRGQCAQACRMPYGLIVDGVIKDLADVSYLLSPQDLMALEVLPQLVAAGVSCFKIEGRLKGPEYVAATTAAYRAGVDAAWEQLMMQQQQQQQQQPTLTPDSTNTPISSGSGDSSSSRRASSSSSSSSNSGSLVPDEVLSTLAQVFARAQDEGHVGLTPGFLEGPRHQRLVRGRAPRHRGLCLGRIAAFTHKGGIILDGLLHPVKRGDGLVFDQGTPELQEQGGSVWDIMAAPPQQQQQLQGPGGSGSSSSRSSNGRGSKRSASGSSKAYVRSSGRKWEGEAAAGGTVELLFGPGQVDVSALSVGDLVWKNRDAALEVQLRSSYESLSSTQARKLPVQVAVSGSLGTPLQLRLSDGDGNTAVADSGDVLLSAAVKRALTPVDVESAVGQLGDNTLSPHSIDLSGLDLEQGLFLPASAFKAVRRAASEQLLTLRQQHPYADNLAQQPMLPAMLAAAATRSTAELATSPQHTPTAQPQPTSSRKNSSRSSSSTSGSSSSSRSRSIHNRGTGISPRIRVLCRTPAQVDAALQLPWLQEVIVDFLEVHGLREAVAAVQGAGKQVVVALPRILKPDESRLLWFYLKLGADALLLRGAGCLQQLLELGGPGAVVNSINDLTTSSSSSSSSSSETKPATSSSAANSSSTAADSAAAAAGGGGGARAGAGPQSVRIPRLEGDFSLNAANVLAADLLLQSGLSRLCPTHDLNAAQLAAMAAGLGAAGTAAAAAADDDDGAAEGQEPLGRAGLLEAVVHQHLPIFHTEHCVFCRFLSEGNDYRDCGHPCERHTVQLRDSSGADHLVLADMGCRNTVFNAAAQSALYYLPRLAAAGYGTFRLELLDEPAALVGPLLETYRRVLMGREKPRTAWQWLQDNCKGGVAAGSLEVKGERAIASLRPSARRQ